jgi:hypothetical protein
MKLLRTVRFDASDTFVFESAAAPDEWAVSGGFAFAHLTAADTTGKLKQAFANGFLGLTSFGRATFATVGEALDADRDAMMETLARHFVAHYGAPDLEAARAAAGEEVDFIAELCRDADINTLFTVRRSWRADGTVKEEFRALPKPRVEDQHANAKIWSVVDDDA